MEGASGAFALFGAEAPEGGGARGGAADAADAAGQGSIASSAKATPQDKKMPRTALPKRRVAALQETEWTMTTSPFCDCNQERFFA